MSPTVTFGVHHCTNVQYVMTTRCEWCYDRTVAGDKLLQRLLREGSPGKMFWGNSQGLVGIKGRSRQAEPMASVKGQARKQRKQGVSGNDNTMLRE